MIKHKNIGFTLIELMVVVAIIGILASFAYPSYVAHVKKTQRTDAMSALLGFASAMERHFTANSTYLGAGKSGDTGTPGIYYDEVPKDSSIKYYDLTIQSASASTYTIRATPKNTQAGDGILEYTSTGIKRWDKNNNGSTTDSGEDRWEP
ncbi:MAG: type IV pilin protein [Hahellaceae bacterium]|nr:type IV pilin protein [Hahellaceae bacterium]MCP5170032.1 type IV pilin protein [Hahellaceae bacterium]